MELLRIARATLRSIFMVFRVPRRVAFVSLALLLILCASLSLKAQSYLENVGIPTFTTSIPVESGFINAASGDLHLEIPLGSFPQRGGRQYRVALVYDSAIWLPVNNSWQPTNVSTADGSGSSWGGWRLVTSGDIGFVHPNSSANGCYGPFIWTAPDGTQHSFPISTAQATNSCSMADTPTDNKFASDASGYHMYVTTYSHSIIKAPDGTKVYDDTSTSSQRLTDSNGNYYSFSAGNITDTVGRTPVTTTVNGNTITYGLPNAQGTTSTFTVVTRTTTVSTSFGQTGFAECCANPITVIDHVTLPDGTSYQFGYDSGFGLLNSMTLPTGSTITYSFTTFPDAYNSRYRWINGRTTPDGPWSYTPQVINSCQVTQVNCQQQVTVGKPNGDKIIYIFNLNGGDWNSRVQYYTGSSNLLATIMQCFNFVSVGSNGQCTYPTSPTSGPPATGVTKSAATTLLAIPGGTVSKTNEYFFDSYGNVNQAKEWNFYTSNLPATPDRTTTIAYSYQTNSAHLSADILNRIQTSTVSDGAGNTVAQTKYCYDYTGGCGGSSFASVTGKKNHDDTNYGTGNSARGDITQTQQLVSGTSTYLTTSATYDMTGQVVSSTDSKGNATTFSHADNFFTDPGNGSNPASYSPPTATNAYLTNITQGSLISSFGYYFGTGQQAVATDPNSKATYSHFADSLSRPTAMLLPNGGWSLTQYNSTDTQVDTYTGITASTPTTGCTGSSGGCRRDQTLLDGMGRVITQILVSDPDGQTKVDTQYDLNGRVKQTSNPYRSLSDPTYGLEVPTYDGLNRVIQVKHADNDLANTYYGVDVGLIGGRSSPSSGLGYPVATKDETGKVRQVWVDGFGRTIEADESSSGAAYSAGTYGSGFIGINGTEQYTQLPNTPGSGYVVISGQTTATWLCGPPYWEYGYGWTQDCWWSYDYGTVSVTVNGWTISANYTGSDCCGLDYGYSVAANLANAINSTGGYPVTAWAQDWGDGWNATLWLTATQPGAQTNYSLSASTWSGQGVGSFSTSPSGDYLTGGSDYTDPDTGSVWIYINGVQASIGYGGGSTAYSVASGLRDSVNGNGSLPVTAALSANCSPTLTSCELDFTAKNVGSATITLSCGSSCSSTSQPNTFSVSFSGTPSGTALTGGTDPVPSPLVNAAITRYTYDLNNNLTGVTAAGGTQTRSYQYDKLSRVTQKIEPETGTTNLYYTTSAGALCGGNPSALCRRTDARNITTTYGYDTLNRLTSKSYSDSTAAVTYSYDQTTYNGLTITNGKGRRTGMSDGSGLTAWSYDEVGNIKTEQRKINNVTKTISYAYNRDGSISSVTYPGGRQVAYTVGNAQRETAGTDTAHSINYAKASSSAMYAPSGAPASIVYGYVSGGGITETRSYNNRLELTRIQAIAASAVLDLGYSYAQNSHNNGNVTTQTNNVDTGRTQNYTYDNLNRLLAAQTQATSGPDCWGQSFGNNATPPTMATDNLANLFYATSTQCSSWQPRYTVTSSNQFTGTGISYDADGDNTADTVYSYTFDAENRIITASGMTGGPYCYTYDGNGMRVKKAHASGGACTGTPTVDVLYWRNLAGNTIAETDSAGSTTNANYHEYVFFAGRRVARSDVSSGNVYYYFVDHLGSTRIMTQANGTVCFNADYYPYGQEIDFTTTCNTTYKFTGYEHDGETGLDYAFARYYNSRIGRFMSGDPVGGDSSDPQTMNRYAYARNNPVNFVDPSGMSFFGSVWGFIGRMWEWGYGWVSYEPDTVGYPDFGPDPTEGVTYTGGSGDFAPEAPAGPDPTQTPEQGPPPSQGQNPPPTATPPKPQSREDICRQVIVDAVNKQFGTEFTVREAINLGPQGVGQTTFNVNINFPVGTVAQGQIHAGRFGGGALGTGATLHVVSFSNSGVDGNGVPVDTIRAHIDQGNPLAFPFVPGAVSHLDYIIGHFVGPPQFGCP